MSARRAVALTWLLLAGVVGSLAVRASLGAPPGTVFAGTFYYVDDFYNYLSSVEQASRGELVFRSKLAPPSLPPALVNLEWLAVGWLAALLGSRPLLAYRVFGLAALALLVWLVERALSRSGLPQRSRLAALLLVFSGGGFGGLLYSTGVLSGERALDLRTGAFPFLEALGNPHFVAGTSLLLGGMSAFAAGWRRTGAALGAVLALVRPYDAALLVGVEAAATVLTNPRRDWIRRLLTVLVPAPLLAYQAWLFGTQPGFRVFASPLYGSVGPAPLDFVIALGPAALLALTALRLEPADGGQRDHLVRLGLWAGGALFVVLLRPVAFAAQFAVGVGLPLLALAALGLARWRPWAPLAAVPLLASTAVVAVRLCSLPSPSTHPPTERWHVALAAGRLCRPGELLVAHADIGLYAGGLGPCWPFVSHTAAADHIQADLAVRAFYDPATPAGERRAFLERTCPAHVVLPPQIPPGWLGEGSRYSPRLVAGGRNGALAVWSRDPGAPCTARSRPDFR